MLSLTDSQKRAVETISKEVLVLAGPGSGKTRTILGRLWYLLENHTPAETVAVVTFTQKAALELHKRLKEMGLPSEKLFIGTIHSLAKNILENTGLSFQVAEDEEVIEILKEKGTKRPQKTLKELSLKRNLLQEDPLRQAMVEALKGKGLIDFDGLLETAIEAQKGHPIRNLEHILIDEVQDLTPLQFEFIKTLSQERTSVFAVGDDDQSIYSFHGSSPEIMKLFTKTFQPCTVVVLQENFRNPLPVFKLASGVISSNRNRFKKDILPLKKDGPKPRLYIFKRPEEEARFIARQIKKLTGGTGYHDLSSTDHRSPSEFGVLVRTR
ncbi:MAG: ATP-dependent helicase, partial [Nitrospirae bacterium]